MVLLSVTIGNYKNGGSQIGCIPLSIDVPDIGFTDDLIVYIPLYYPVQVLKRSIPELPLACYIPKEDSIASDFAMPINNLMFQVHDKPAIVKIANTYQRLELEKMIYNSAAQGESFGLDEFDGDGTYSRKLFHTSMTIVLSQDSRCIGGIICGSSALCRSRNAPNLGFQLVIDKLTSSETQLKYPIDNDGVSDVLYEVVQKLAQHHKYKGIITNILFSDSASIKQAMKHQLVITGSIPYSAYVKGKGNTHALLMHHMFIPTSHL